jgi:hypothetical protein
MKRSIRNFIACITLLLATGAGFNPSAWAQVPIDPATEAFDADVYPSRSTAVSQLVRKLLVEELQERIKPDVSIAVTGDHKHLLLDALRHHLPSTNVKADVADGDAIVFAVTETDVREPSSPDVKVVSGKPAPTPRALPRSGRVNVTVSGKGFSNSATARFVEKPWADDWNLYRNSEPDKRWMLAESTQLYANEAEAMDSAQRRAVELLAPLVKESMSAKAKRSGREIIRVTDEWVRKAILSSVQRNHDNQLIPDQFVQKFDRPYGEVWKASLLIDASQKTMDSLVASYNALANAERNVERKSKVTGFSAIGGMALVVVLLYAFLNSATKGYFAWRLRALALLAVIAGVLVVFAVT